MSTTISAMPSVGDRPTGATPVRDQSLATAIHSEWVKLRTLRSTWIGLAATLVVLVGFGAIASAVSTGTVTSPDGDGPGGGPFGGVGPVSTVLMGSTFAVLLVGILGALVGAREYGSRMIAATVAAVPRRWQVLVAKSVVFGLVALVTSLIGVLAAFRLGMGILEDGGVATVTLSDPEVARQVLGMAGYITAVGLIGTGLGVLLRSVAGSIGAVVAGFMVLPPLAGALLPSDWDPVLQYLPSSAGAAFTTIQPAGTEVLGAGAGALVLAGWVAAVLAGALVSITRRDV